MQTDHEDKEHPKHCTENLFNAQTESSSGMMNMISGCS
jgi:hypothetical protein